MRKKMARDRVSTERKSYLHVSIPHHGEKIRHIAVKTGVMIMKHAACIVIFLAMGALCWLHGASIEGKVVIGGVERTYVIHIPKKSAKNAKLPLVIVLHGGGGNAMNAAKMSGMSEKADTEGFIALYPNGTGRMSDRFLTWNAGNCCGEALERKSNDIAFIAALIDRMVKKHDADPSRVYVTGISNGGMMTYALACELSGKIAAIAPVAGAMNWKKCAPRSPVPVMIFHGTADQHVRYEGGKPNINVDWRHYRVDASVKDAVEFWVKRNGCSPNPERSVHGEVETTVYRGEAGGADVVVKTIRGGRHSWPGGRKGRPKADEPFSGMSATDVMWDFFKNHAKKADY